MTKKSAEWWRAYRERRKQPDYAVRHRAKYPKRVVKLLNTYRWFDKKYGLDHDLPHDWFMENIEGKPCHHCGCGGPMGADRIDNHRGHTRDNVRPSCVACNSKHGGIWGAEQAKKAPRRVCNTAAERHPGEFA